MSSVHSRSAIHIDHNGRHDAHLDFIGEEPLSIRIEGRAYSVLMRTPGDEKAHVAGFIFTEGVADAPEDVSDIAFCDGADANVVAVTLTPGRRKAAAGHLDRRGFISQTSCGLCGKEIVEDLFQEIRPLPDSDETVDAGAALSLVQSLRDHQPLGRLTRASHAAAIYGPDQTLMASAEDVGRHNALDKAIGKIFLENRISDIRFLIMSSRMSYELVQKAARARIPVVISVSRPTALAVELASRLNMTLACLSKSEGFYIICGERRFSLRAENA